MAAWHSRNADLTQPHPALTEYYGDPREREAFVRQLFDSSAADYDRINGIMSLGSGAWYRRRVLRDHGLAPRHRVLDIAVGTGLLAREAAGIVQPEGLVVGLDPSFGMLAQARASLALPLVQGRAEALPFQDASFDMVTMGYALRHMADFGSVFAEFRRVLKPGGKLLVLEIARAENRFVQAAAMLWLGRIIPALCGLMMPRRQGRLLMQYYWDTIEECVPAATIEAELRASGFLDVGSTATLGVFREYAGVTPPA
ncbi:class I SAM-dependent methyltransferase [Sediminicoccus sp. KRV36]|uniref:class I SAM-dependent methyltransferase n=1 Tax=Sediminicoccus sp. KRV36 TaxID=3133721 RepID=UPI00200CECB6|nr:class I SAM-dependent methyltransferase [Sediminicoccus rosea]UPY37599.1 class I SAM-dependent methyltransferase [Sediminicoccus rosea]